MARRAGKHANDSGTAEATAADGPPLPIELPSAMFSGPGLLTLADLLPVMTAFVDRDLRYRFMNKPLAEWLERPRREMIGLHMQEVIGDKAFEHRQPMIEAALAGERQFFAATSRSRRSTSPGSTPRRTRSTVSSSS